MLRIVVFVIVSVGKFFFVFLVIVSVVGECVGVFKLFCMRRYDVLVCF